MELIKIKNGEQESYSVGQLRRDNKSISFPKTIGASTLADYGVYTVVEEDVPVYNKIAQSITRSETAINVNGQWTYRWIIEDKTLEDIADLNRAERDRRLAETDYLALSDVTMSDAMTTYRQALRDITTHANWPNLAYPDMDGSGGDWPTKP